MSHIRTQIRKRVKTLLSGLAATGGNVFVGRTWPLERPSLPCLLVYTTDEPSADAAFSPIRQQRVVTLTVEGRVAGIDDEAMLDSLDELARQVEVALLAAGALASLALAIELTQTLATTTAGNDGRWGQVEMTFRVEYHTAAGAPDTAL